ncbi:hypothetical protein [Pseudomonas sp. NFXW11]
MNCPSASLPVLLAAPYVFSTPPGPAHNLCLSATGPRFRAPG